jgi:ribonuclease BN (tRNA processing enzyme)
MVRFSAIMLRSRGHLGWTSGVDMRVRVLGCSGGIGEGLRTTSLLIDDDILIDCGTGVGDLTLDEMSRLRHVFITHTHLDHIAALPLLVDTIFGSLQREPLAIHAQRASMEIIQRHIFNWEIWPDFFELPERERPVVQFEEMEAGQTVDVDGRTLEMVKVNHAVPAVGYVLNNDRSTIAFSGDTTTNDTLWEALNRQTRLDLLIIECAFADQQRSLSESAKHYCPSSLAADLARLRHHPRVLITHLKPGDEERIFGEICAHIPDRDLVRLRGGEVFEL